MLLAAAHREPPAPAGPDFTGMSLWEIAQGKLHHGQGRFINPFNPGLGKRSFLEVLTWKLSPDNPFKQYYAGERVTPVSIDWARIRNHHSLSVTFVTHSTVLLRDDHASIIVDPVLSGLFWPIKDFSPLNIPAGDVPQVDAVLLTHGHYDHLDLKSLRLFNDSARFICPLGYASLLKSNGARLTRELDWLDSVRVNGFEITFLPCNHWTMRNPFTGPNTALWGSYLVKTPSGRVIYISGDTAYFDGFKEIGQHYDIDLAIFNLGAYEPRWFMKSSHINPEETVRAFRELGAKKLLVVHWGTFRLGDEPVFQPPLDMGREMEKAGLMDRLVELKHGQTLLLD